MDTVNFKNANDPFATTKEEGRDNSKIHIRVQQRNGRKCITTVQGLAEDLDIKKIAKALNMIKRYDRKLYLRVVKISFVRYIAFAIQFYLLLQLFSDFSLPIEALLLVPAAYLMQSLVPVPAISDVGVRVAVSQLLFGSFILNAPILQAVTCLWFINLILPGLFGTIYLLFSSIRKR